MRVSLIPVLACFALVLPPACVDAGPEFAVSFEDADQVRGWIADGTLEAGDCTLTPVTIDGVGCLRLTTQSEFSDALLDLTKLAGGPLDLSAARFLTLRLHVPQPSWIAAVKLNLRAADGSFGGVPEVANNFVPHRGRWVTVVADLRLALPRFQLWHGETDPRPHATHVSLNPYCADQSRPSSLCIRSLSLSDTRPPRQPDEVAALAERPSHPAGLPFAMDFDDETALRRLTAWRSFESSVQAFAVGVAGNPTRAIRLQGKESNRHIAFLPMFERMSGQPLDLTAAKRITFRYHLVPGSDPVEGATLFLADEGWSRVALDRDIGVRFEPGGWRDATIDLTALRFGGQPLAEVPFADAVHELRLDLNYRPGQKAITLWLDDFRIE